MQCLNRFLLFFNNFVFSINFVLSARITHLSLRNNRIGEEGARLIGLALSKNLLSLNMAFNTVGDAGAIYLAQVLKFTSLSTQHNGNTSVSIFVDFHLTF